MRKRTVNLRQGKSKAVRRYHVCRRALRVPHTGQIALTALGTTLIITEPSGSTARLVIRQRSFPTSRSSASIAASRRQPTRDLALPEDLHQICR